MSDVVIVIARGVKTTIITKISEESKEYLQKQAKRMFFKMDCSCIAFLNQMSMVEAIQDGKY